MEGFSAGLVDDRCGLPCLPAACLRVPANSAGVETSALWQHPPVPACVLTSALRSNLFEWAVTVLGPPDTLYEGGFFNAGQLMCTAASWVGNPLACRLYPHVACEFH